MSGVPKRKRTFLSQAETSNGKVKNENPNKVIKFNEPLSSDDLPFPAGICTMMRLPWVDSAKGLDACFVGIPIDHGTSYKTGARLGPRHIRMESTTIAKINVPTGADPFGSLQVADIGDLKVNTYDLKKCVKEIEEQLSEIIRDGCRPLVLGGDHTISYPLLKSLAHKYGPMAMVHVDAHSECNDIVEGEKICHSTMFARGIEENLFDCKKVFQIGIRGCRAVPNPYEWQTKKGFRIIPAKDCWNKSLAPLMKEVRQIVGDSPTYICFDVDGLDPSHAPGTGFREIGGLTTAQAQEILQGCRGLNVVGADMVEVCPAMDPSGLTAETAAKLLFEILCILPGVKYHELEKGKN